MSPENTLLQPREEEGVKYERTFMASEFLDWLVQEGEATAREEAEQLCRRLLEHGIIQHGERALPAPMAHALHSPGSLSQPCCCLGSAQLTFKLGAKFTFHAFSFWDSAQRSIHSLAYIVGCCAFFFFWNILF